jgi:hypothetical protein
LHLPSSKIMSTEAEEYPLLEIMSTEAEEYPLLGAIT